jgi:hypothetical protein
VCIFSFFLKKATLCYLCQCHSTAASLLVPLEPPLDRFPDLLDHEDEDGKRDEEEPRSASAPTGQYGQGTAGRRGGTRNREKPSTLNLMKTHLFMYSTLFYFSLGCKVPEGRR